MATGHAAMSMPDGMWPLTLLIFVFAGSIKGLVGVGMPTAAVSIFAQIADPRLAIALLIIPSLALNIWQIIRSGQLSATVRQIWPFCLVMMFGIWYFARFAAGLAVGSILIGVGIVIVIFVISNLVKPPRIAPAFDIPAQLGFGSIAGLMGGLTGIWSPAVVSYLLATEADREKYLAATGILILMGSSMLMVGYWQGGLLSTELAGQSALMVIPTLLGFAIGEWLRRTIGSEHFRSMVLIVFFLMGLNLIRRGLT